MTKNSKMLKSLVFRSLFALFTVCAMIILPNNAEAQNCAGLDYCFTPGSTSFEWLDSVVVNNYVNASGNNEGYAFFEENIEAFEIGQEVSFRLSPGYSGFAYTENFMVFIDANQDGEFAVDEMLFLETANAPVEGTFIIPEETLPGATTMRILMNFNAGDGEACPAYTYDGETEDYCIEIKQPFVECLPVQNFTLGPITTGTVTLKWEAPEDALGYEVNYKAVGSADWLTAISQTTSLYIDDLEICTEYEVQINTICTNGQSGFPMESDIVQTSCTVGSNEIEELDRAISVFPNPTAGPLNLNFDATEYGTIQVEVSNAQGQKIGNEVNFEVVPGKNQLSLQSVSDINSGLYFVKVRQNNTVVIKKLMKL